MALLLDSPRVVYVEVVGIVSLSTTTYHVHNDSGLQCHEPGIARQVQAEKRNQRLTSAHGPHETPSGNLV